MSAAAAAAPCSSDAIALAGLTLVGRCMQYAEAQLNMPSNYGLVFLHKMFSSDKNVAGVISSSLFALSNLPVLWSPP